MMYLYSDQNWTMHCLMRTKVLFVPVRKKSHIYYIYLLYTVSSIVLARLDIDGLDVAEGSTSASFCLFLQCSAGKFN